MLCKVDKPLSVLMTLRMCLRELCCLCGIFYYLDLNHLVRVFYLLMFSYRLSLETARCCFLGSKSIFHLQITGVCYNITSPVTEKSADLAFKFEKIVGLFLFDIDK